MSTWTGGNNGKPDAYSETRCCWTLCTGRVPFRFLSYELALCQEHALHVWATIQEQLDAGTVTQPTPTPRQQDDDDNGWVYYVRTGSRIKIGYTTNIDRRLSQYPPDIEILYIQPGDKNLERSEHHRFHVYLTDGREWFQDRPEVTKPIIDMATNDKHWREFHAEEYWRRRPARHTRPTDMTSSKRKDVA